MIFRSFFLCLVLAGAPLVAQSLPPESQPRLRFIDTGFADTREGLVFKGGALSKKVRVIHPAFLIEHQGQRILFDTGLGRQARAQVKQDMPWWAAKLTAFTHTASAADVLARHGLKVDRVLLSHAHFDHASGLPDLPVPVAVSRPELDWLRTARTAALLPSIFQGPITWQPFDLEDKPYEGFPRSLDLMGDGRLVLVPLAGHTPGSVGLFVNAQPRVLLVGDAVWSTRALVLGAPKFWLARRMVDHHPEQVSGCIRQLQALQKRLPDLRIIPSHDEAAVRQLEEVK